MRAVVVQEFGGPEVLRVSDRPDPAPGPGEVLVRVRAAGVNPVETYIRAGQYARLPALPYVPGSDGAGEVVAVGADVSRYRPGDRVYVHGAPTYAELTVAPESAVWPLPDAVDFMEGAAIGIPYFTAYRALFLVGRARAGEWVLIHGASGGVGVAAVQLGRTRGLSMVGTAGTDAGRELVRREGAEAVGHDAWEQALAYTGGRGFDLIVEMAAHVNLGRDLEVLAPQGRVVVVGSRGPVSVNPRDLMSREAAVYGVMETFNTAADRAAIHAALYEEMAHGRLKPVVGRQFSLEEAPSAHRAVMESGAYGKIVLIP